MPDLTADPGYVMSDPGTDLDVPVSNWDLAGASLMQMWEHNPTAVLGRGLRVFTEENFGGERVSKADADAEVKRNGLKLDIPAGGITRYELDMLQWLQQQDQARAKIFARPRLWGGDLAAFGGAFVGAAIDPLNIASGMIPIVREARLEEMFAVAGMRAFAPAAARVAAGALDGALSSAALETVHIAGAHWEQTPYDAGDFFFNVALGTLGGAVFHGRGKGGEPQLAGLPARALRLVDEPRLRIAAETPGGGRSYRLEEDGGHGGSHGDGVDDGGGHRDDAPESAGIPSKEETDKLQDFARAIERDMPPPPATRPAWRTIEELRAATTVKPVIAAEDAAAHAAARQAAENAKTPTVHEIETETAQLHAQIDEKRGLGQVGAKMDGELARADAVARRMEETALRYEKLAKDGQVESLLRGEREGASASPGAGGPSVAPSPTGGPMPVGPHTRLSQPGGLMATEGDQVFMPQKNKWSEPTHPLERHGPDNDDKFLQDRVQSELIAKGKVGPRTAFNDRSRMEEAISETISLRQREISDWLATKPDPGDLKAFKADPGMGNLGRGFEVVTAGGPIIPITRPMTNVKLILKSDGQGGYLIHTAHPD